MTRINAGSTLSNQYAPPFVVSDSVQNNWELRWNANIIAFEAYDPSALVVAAGFNKIEQALFSAVTNQQVFVVPWGIDPALIASEQRATLYITINGVKQHTNTFTLASGTNTTTITIGGPATGDVEIIGLQATGGAKVNLFNAVGDNTQNAFPLSWLAPSTQSLLITLDGLKLDTSAYTISSNPAFTITTITFDTAPGNLVAIEVVGITTTGEIPASPVNASNLGAGTGIFGAKRQVGEEQILDFKSVVAGAGITIVSTANDITIDAPVLVTNNLGSGQQVLSPGANGAKNPLTLHSINGGNRITVGLANGELTWSVDGGYVVAGATPHNAAATDRLIGISNLPAAYTVNLSPIINLPAGDTITIKNQTVGIFPITINTAGAELIDGAATATITTAFGYITLYSDGTNYFIIAQG